MLNEHQLRLSGELNELLSPMASTAEAIDALCRRLASAVQFDVRSAKVQLISIESDDAKELVAACAGFSMDDIHRICDLLRTHVLGPAMYHVSAICFAERLSQITRIRFGLTEPPDESFVSSLKHAMAAVQMDLIGEFLVAAHRGMPQEVWQLPEEEGEIALNELCQCSIDATAYVDELSRLAERLATQLLQNILGSLYKPAGTRPRVPMRLSSSEDDAEMRERAMREGFQWISLVIAWFRAVVSVIITASTGSRHWLPITILLSLVAQSLLDSLTIAVLRQVCPILFRPLECPKSENDPAFESMRKEAEQQLLLRQQTVLDAAHLLDLLRAQWTRSKSAEAYWDRVEKNALAAYYEVCYRSLHNISMLCWAGESRHFARRSLPVEWPLLQSAQPNCRVTAVNAVSEDLAVWNVGTSDNGPLLNLVNARSLHAIERFTAVTNCATVHFWMPDLIDAVFAHIAVHHSRGKPSHGRQCLIPLDELFLPDERIFNVVERMTAILASTMETWQDNWEELQLSSSPIANPREWSDSLHLVLLGCDDEERELFVEFFVINEDQQSNWIDFGECFHLPTDVHDLFKKHGVPLPRSPCGVLIDSQDITNVANEGDY